MTWEKYSLCFRLLSPLHIGHRKVGNLMQTRGYVPGKVLWAALTARLTRDSGQGDQGQRYVDIGRAVNAAFRFEYLYPGLRQSSSEVVTPYYPWADELFASRFLSSYASTALNYNQHSASEGMLHEVEFLRPLAQSFSNNDNPHQVYLVGNMHIKTDLPPDLTSWREALERAQFGGERGYGWGRVALDSVSSNGTTDQTPTVTVDKSKRAYAHVKVNAGKLSGPIEPVLGWERNNNQTHNGPSWGISSTVACFSPGAVVTELHTFTIGDFGIWE